MLLLCVGTGGLVPLSSCFPHMREQPSLKPFERPMAPMPEGVVSRDGPDPVAAPEKAPVPVLTATDVFTRGRLYYGYYCAMCHGDDGGGRTPVGEAYWPRPTDLAGADVQRLTDDELYRKMLTGTGHDPVLVSTVARDRRWPIVAYVRALAARGRPELPRPRTRP
jgi:mono/diheme cytochrome c family protein